MALTEYTILDAYAAHSHAFIRGCGKDTMRYWVFDAIGEYHHKKDIRRVINKMVDDGIFIKYRSPTNHSCFKLNSSECYVSEGIVDNISMRRFGKCPVCEKQDLWMRSIYFSQSCDENTNKMYVTVIEYRDVSTCGEMSLAQAQKLDFYKRIVKIHVIERRGTK